MGVPRTRCARAGPSAEYCPLARSTCAYAAHAAVIAQPVALGAVLHILEETLNGCYEAFALLNWATEHVQRVALRAFPAYARQPHEFGHRLTEELR